jgi:hypothetical protein
MARSLQMMLPSQQTLGMLSSGLQHLEQRMQVVYRLAPKHKLYGFASCIKLPFTISN